MNIINFTDPSRQHRQTFHQLHLRLKIKTHLNLAQMTVRWLKLDITP